MCVLSLGWDDESVCVSMCVYVCDPGRVLVLLVPQGALQEWREQSEALAHSSPVNGGLKRKS